ncbi:MAG: Ldh family oxidoreductase [Bosea sp.]|uniref:Ldh family oxidoreductase n=1 Tax=Bosea sp. (in: a-proteobacteria) TaxID=1871050 RepID=UPI002396812F|nr:Ldh family oxidoreductase [Bosea sp. (in: a-proteobacteria)]MCP4735637.1 Ldh family oxidoreductase [Bosea sp. (in: a-proteobacteria)]
MIAAPTAVAKLSAALGDGPAATLAASALVEADALGLPRFGIAMLDEWAADPAPLPATGEPQAISWRDCSACFAPLAVASATLDIEVAARQFGLAAVFLRGVRGFGRLAPFVRHLADAGLVGFAGAEGPPFVAPHGGTKAVIGTNPLAIAMGRGEERIVIDIASSNATMADIRNARATGKPLPEGIALDAEGRPTSVAAEVAALLPRGGQIGSLLGLVVELMAGVAGGGRGDPKGRGVFLLAFDPAAAAESPDWQVKLAGLKSDWTIGGGHWPRGGGLPAEATLDAEFAQRLDAHLDRMTNRGAR